MIAPHILDFCIVGGCMMAAGFLIGGSFILWITRWEKGMACKAHGECFGCRLDEAEDTARQLDIKYAPLWNVVNDLEPKMELKHSQMREYVDAQIRRLDSLISSIKEKT